MSSPQSAAIECFLARLGKSPHPPLDRLGVPELTVPTPSVAWTRLLMGGGGSLPPNRETGALADAEHGLPLVLLRVADVLRSVVTGLCPHGLQPSDVLDLAAPPPPKTLSATIP